jgi:hypothetical protein
MSKQSTFRAFALAANTAAALGLFFVGLFFSNATSKLTDLGPRGPYLKADGKLSLQADGKLSARERQSIIALHSEFTNWQPTQSATWIQHGATRHVCLRAGGICSLNSMPYDAVVFDDAGQVVEANIIHGSDTGMAENIWDISPLRVCFKARGGKLYVESGEFSQATWRHELQKRMDGLKEFRDLVERFHRSGSTNFAEFIDATRNSPR